LETLLSGLPKNNDPNLLVGFESHDDAGVYRLNDDMAIVVTADFITPPVDDPFIYGQIAAANAISDVYAMGGRPLACLNLVCFPPKKLEADILHRITAGALDKITEAGAVLAGGHTVEDDEPKFGLSVTGIVHPEKYWSNSGAESGDVLVLTKPIGSGVLFNANIKGWVSDHAMSACIETLLKLNRSAAEVAGEFEVHGATDVTGFGLAGHAYEMASGSKTCLEIQINEIPVMPEALNMYQKGMNTGVNAYNKQLVGNHARFDIDLPKWHRQIVFDPQTSGGLLLSVPESQAESLIKRLKAAGVESAQIIGKVKPLVDHTLLVFT
jgi:selenide,water dikinase